MGRAAGWVLSVCVEAFEAGGSFRYENKPKRLPGYGPPDTERSAIEADRRARRMMRRYAVANGLNRFGTLTFRDEGCHDPYAFRDHMGAFWKRLRALRGGKPFPYLYVPEWHKTDHGLHGHYLMGRYVKRSQIEAAWPHGHVFIKMIGDLPVGSGKTEEARIGARYLAKYLGKDVGHERIPGLHRYDVAQGFTPVTREVWGRTVDEAVDRACEFFGGRRPSWSWDSGDLEVLWTGPPSVSFRWDG